MATQIITLNEDSRDQDIVVRACLSDGVVMSFNIFKLNDKLYAVADSGETIILSPGSTQVIS